MSQPEAEDVGYGEVETALRADVAELGELTGSFRRTLAAVSYVLAHRLDLVDSEDGATAASLARTMLATLAALAKGGGGDDDALRDFAAHMSTAVRDPAES